jgi:hypothetical protein
MLNFSFWVHFSTDVLLGICNMMQVKKSGAACPNATCFSIQLRRIGGLTIGKQTDIFTKC